MNLICFSYAGGSAAIFKSWKSYLGNDINICPVELPGRGYKFGESLSLTIDDIISAVYKEIEPLLYNNYALFGHSMGTIVVTELIYKLINNHKPEPKQIFMSGRFPPHLSGGKLISKLNNCDFISEVTKFGGMPDELLNNKEILEFFLPILRSDFKCIEDYKFKHLLGYWKSNISIFYSSEDKTYNEKSYIQWEKYSQGQCSFYGFKGGHFFIHSDESSMVYKIKEILLNNYK